MNHHRTLTAAFIAFFGTYSACASNTENGLTITNENVAIALTPTVSNICTSKGHIYTWSYDSTHKKINFSGHYQGDKRKGGCIIDHHALYFTKKVTLPMLLISHGWMASCTFVVGVGYHGAGQHPEYVDNNMLCTNPSIVAEHKNAPADPNLTYNIKLEQIPSHDVNNIVFKFHNAYSDGTMDDSTQFKTASFLLSKTKNHNVSSGEHYWGTFSTPMATSSLNHSLTIRINASRKTSTTLAAPFNKLSGNRELRTGFVNYKKNIATALNFYINGVLSINDTIVNGVISLAQYHEGRNEWWIGNPLATNIVEPISSGDIYTKGHMMLTTNQPEISYCIYAPYRSSKKIDSPFFDVYFAKKISDGGFSCAK